MLDSRTRPPGGRPITWRVALLALLMLAAVAAAPAAAEAKNFKVDGRVKGAPAAKGGAVTVPLQLTRAAGRKLRTRHQEREREDQAARAASPVGLGRAGRPPAAGDRAPGG